MQHSTRLPYWRRETYEEKSNHPGVWKKGLPQGSSGQNIAGKQQKLLTTTAAHNRVNKNIRAQHPAVSPLKGGDTRSGTKRKSSFHEERRRDSEDAAPCPATEKRKINGALSEGVRFTNQRRVKRKKGGTWRLVVTGRQESKRSAPVASG